MEYKEYSANVEFDSDASIFEARKAGKSLNVWISDAIYKALKDNIQQGHSL
jgi:predicted HicB family RNase H-like nuclease